MRHIRILAAGFVFLTAGCYHTVVDTGRVPSGAVLEDKWADSFVEGLVPPDAVETAQACPNGIAKVETRISFLNGLVRLLTWGIYTPMEITVHCAAANGGDDSSSIRVRSGASDREVGMALEKAASLSAAIEGPAYLILGTE